MEGMVVLAIDNSHPQRQFSQFASSLQTTESRTYDNNANFVLCHNAPSARMQSARPPLASERYIDSFMASKSELFSPKNRASANSHKCRCVRNFRTSGETCWRSQLFSS